MKAREFWAKQYAENWTKPRLPEAEIAALSGAYLAGFNAACERAAGMMGNLGNKGAGILIEAIGKGAVDPETGDSLVD